MHGEDEERDLRRLSVDDVWIVEWAERGHCQIDRFLGLHAAFERYLVERSLRQARHEAPDDRH